MEEALTNSLAAKLSPESSSEPSREHSEGPVRTPRRRERRVAIQDLLTALARSLDRRQEIGFMRGTFEALVRRMVLAQGVQLREAGVRPLGSMPTSAVTDPSPPLETMALDVPGADPVSGVLEAAFGAGATPSAWDFQMLGQAASIGALVLEIDRTRLQLARAGLLVPNRPRRDGAAPLIGSSAVMRVLRSTIERVSATDFTILLQGESGAGKELVARQIHDLSRRRQGPFVAVNCAALVETLLEAELFGIEERTATGVRGRRGKFESADGGTLFLDEVSDLSLSGQAKLLRAIQDLSIERVGGNTTHRVDVRIIAATNRSLLELTSQGHFRQDLFYRLSGVDVRVPTLRERPTDVVELTQYFLARVPSPRRLRLSAAATNALVSHSWPGNVRELERLVERAVALAESDVIELDDLPPAVRGDHAIVIGPSLQRNDTLRAWANRYVRVVLDRCHDNKQAACRILGISYHTLQAHLRDAVNDQTVNGKGRGKAEEPAAVDWPGVSGTT